jgi:hypothetical protein
MTGSQQAHPRRASRFSDELERWATSETEKTVGTLIDTFEEKSFAVLFVLLLGPSALPLPTGGATQVFEAIAMVLALQLVVGRRSIWLPRRWRERTLAGGTHDRVLNRLLSMIRWLERWSRLRGQFLFGSRAGNVAFGGLVLVGTAASFVAPPFSMLDTLPSLGVVVLSIAVLMEDLVLAGIGVVIGAAGVALLAALGRAVVRGVADLF